MLFGPFSIREFKRYSEELKRLPVPFETVESLDELAQQEQAFTSDVISYSSARSKDYEPRYLYFEISDSLAILHRNVLESLGVAQPMTGTDNSALNYSCPVCGHGSPTPGVCAAHGRKLSGPDELEGQSSAKRKKAKWVQQVAVGWMVLSLVALVFYLHAMMS